MNWGLDVGGRRLDLVCIETGEVAQLRLPASKVGRDDRPEILRAMQSWVTQHCPIGYQGSLWIDAPFNGGAVRNRGTQMMLAGVSDAARAAWLGPSYLVNPSTWKKEVVGHGHADKDEIRAWLERAFPEIAAACEGSQDLADAACVAEYGRRRSAGEVEGPKRVRKRRPGAVLRAG